MAGYQDLLQLRDILDPADMLGRVISFPDQMAEAWRLGGDFASRLPASHANRIVVCGMGGSAIGGDMVRSFYGDGLRVPLYVNRDYEVRHWLRKDAFFVFSSYSGNTGETLAAYAAIAGQGIPSIAITSGGELGRRCKEDGVPLCEIPGGMPPRSAIAYSFFPLLRVLSATGLADAVDEREFEETCRALRDEVARFAAPDDNPAAALAQRLYGKVPFVYAAPGLMEAVARRWVCQFNENAKVVAHGATFTELCHNEIVGWTQTPSLPKNAVVLSLEDIEDHPLARKQADIALDIVRPMAAVDHFSGFRGPRLRRILAAMLLGDFASVYLAYANGVDPTPVENIDHLKSKLSG